MLQLPTNTDDEQLYATCANLALTLAENGQTWFDLDANTTDQLSKAVQYNSPAGYMAGGITALCGVSPVTVPKPVIDSAGLDSAITAMDTTTGNGQGGQGAGKMAKTKTATSSFSAYPNPTNGGLTINAPASGTFVLSTILGQKVVEYRVTLGGTELELPEHLAPGIYLGRFTSSDGKTINEIEVVYQP